MRLTADDGCGMEATTITCRVCGQSNPATALFCSRCTSPVAVVSLHDLTDRDLHACLGALFSVLGEELTRSTPDATPADPDLWRAYLSAFWLRPETALVLYAEAMAIRQVIEGGRGAWLDLGCGDGVHSALCAGWRFDPLFDTFQSLDLSAGDVYNRFDPADFAVTIEQEGRPIDVGLDIKETAVARAKALGVFRRVEQADATRLPLADGSVRTIFSNMLRDLGEPLGAALDECRRVLSDEGILLISAMTPAYPAHLYFAPRARHAADRGERDQAADFLKLDRGRSVFCQRQLTPDQWNDLLQRHGLRVRRVVPIAGPAVIRFWDIGLRPFTTALLRQRETWRRQGALGAVKPPAVALLDRVLAPLLAHLIDGEPCMNLLAVEKA